MSKISNEFQVISLLTKNIDNFFGECLVLLCKQNAISFFILLFYMFIQASLQSITLTNISINDFLNLSTFLTLALFAAFILLIPRNFLIHQSSILIDNKPHLLCILFLCRIIDKLKSCKYNNLQRKLITDTRFLFLQLYITVLSRIISCIHLDTIIRRGL